MSHEISLELDDEPTQVVDERKGSSESEEDVDDEEEEADDDNSFVVKEIKDMKIVGKQLLFKTTWETDGTTTWEPLKHFGKGIEHNEIQRFKANNLEKFESLYNQIYGEKKAKRSTTGSYYYDDSEVITEAPPDANLSREARALYNPQKLKDPLESFVSCVNVGGRMSRSQTQKLRATGASASPAPQVNTPPAVQKRRRAPGGGRKKKNETKVETTPSSTSPKRKRRKNKEKPESPKEEEKDVPSSSAGSSSTSAAPKKIANEKKKEAASSSAGSAEISVPPKKIKKEEKKEEPSSSPSPSSTPAVPQKIANEEKKDVPSISSAMPVIAKKAPIKPIPKKKKVEKLNSSDSSEEEEEEEEAPPPPPPVPKVKKLTKRMPDPSEGDRSRSPSLKRANIEKKPKKVEKEKPQSSVAGSSSSSRPAEPVVKHDPSPSPQPEKPRVRNPDVVYPGDAEAIEAEQDEELLRRFGIRMPSETPQEMHERVKEEARLKYEPLNMTIYRAIMERDNMCITWLLTQNRNEELIDCVFRMDPSKRPLHKILIRTFEMQSGPGVDEDLLNSRRCSSVRVFQAVMPHLSSEAMSTLCNEKNTWLHWAIFSENTDLAKYLIDIGSPLHMRNCNGQNALDAALYTRNLDLIDHLIKNGSTFHFLVGDNIRNYEREENERQRRDLFGKRAPEKTPQILGLTKSLYSQIDTVFNRLRGSSLRATHIECDASVIFTYPRGKCAEEGSIQKVQIRIPENWVALEPDADVKYEFMLAVIQMDYNWSEKVFVGKPQRTLMFNPLIFEEECPHSSTIYYDATKAIYKRKEMLKRQVGNELGKPSLYTVTMRFREDEPLQWMAAQLIRCQKKNARPRTFQPHSHSHSNSPSTPSYYNSPRYSTPRI